MLDIAKMLSGLFQGGGLDKKEIQPEMQTPGINPDSINQTPGIITPNGLPELMPPGQPTIAPNTGIDWKQRMLGGLQGFQAAQQPQQVPPPMDMSQMQQMQFAHKQNAGIIPRQGRY